MDTVLIVEDEKMIRQGIKTMIQRSGVPVNIIMESSNGQQALEILENQKIDVMFTDIRMPKMDGIELVQHIHDMDHKPLVVAISGYDDFSYAVELLRMGIREYLLKPVDREKVKEVLLKLEAEIKQGAESSSEIRNIGYQQLKYLMLNQQITEKEMEVMSQQFEKQLFSGEYIVCCCESKNMEQEQNDHYVFLNHVGKYDIYIVEKNKKEFLLKNELKHTYVGTSSIHHGIKELKQAYLEAKAARKEAFRICSKAVSYCDIPKKVHDEKISQESVAQIAQIIGTDKLDTAIKMLSRIVQDTKKDKYSIGSFEESMNYLVNRITKTYQNVLQLEMEELSKFQIIYQYTGIDEYFESLSLWLVHFNEKINVQFDDYKNKHKVQQAIEFINKNYNKDLNMAVVSNHISMNYSLFSYVFKQYTGGNFVNYLKDIRIKEAKRLLEETDMLVIEISQKVGYENEKHFMKIFKGVCGVSPTEYRKNMQFTK